MSTTITPPLDMLNAAPEPLVSTDKGVSLLTLDNRVFCCYLFWASILVVKMCLMSVLTAVQRIRKKAFINKEDLAAANAEPQYNDPDVERVRRAHLNDMENILPYLTMSLIYVCVNPKSVVACNLFRIAAVARVTHTLVYAFYPVPQPARGICFGIAFAITIYMGFAVACHTIKYI